MSKEFVKQQMTKVSLLTPSLLLSGTFEACACPTLNPKLQKSANQPHPDYKKMDFRLCYIIA
jgi:hypothetical protein